MPHIVDFSRLENVKTIEIAPEGWITPLYVEYGIGDDRETSSYFWRVKGTSHTFIIPISRMDYLSSGNYKKHFTNALEVFREDYISWKDAGFLTEWSREYYNQYNRFIVV
jgi:hypothetical protein